MNFISCQHDCSSQKEQTLPFALNKIHFVGIGGIGMSGLAEILKDMGYLVCGSDQRENSNVMRLRTLGIDIAIGHDAALVKDSDVVVISSAIQENNPELIAAKAARIPVIRRAEMLAEIMRLKWSVAVAGTHGKTTTTSMVASLFEVAGFDPTVINGGIIHEYGTNARLGHGDWLVAESDESDGTFTKLPSTICIVTNMDPEHMEHYGSFQAVQKAYEEFVHNVPFYGFAILGIDHPEVLALSKKTEDKNCITYGFDENADVHAFNLRPSVHGTVFDVRFLDHKTQESHVLKDLLLPVVGKHNVQNSLAVLALGSRLQLSDHCLREALARFEGVKHRFTKTGTVRGITIIDDYGHHPTEIATTILAAGQAKQKGGRVIAVVQPHRYSRLHSLFDTFCTCFDAADAVIVADVYPAGEKPIEGVHRDALVEGLRKHGHGDVSALASPDDLSKMIAEKAQSGDLVLCLGAGSIGQWAAKLPDELESFLNAQESV